MFAPVPISRRFFHALCFVVFAVLFYSMADAGNITVGTTILGPTPTVVGYDTGPFCPTSNAGDWWRYSGTTGARIFVTPSSIEPDSEFPAIGQTVTNQASFLNLKAQVRANPWSTAYLNWSYFTNQLNTPMLIGADFVDVDYALSNWQQMGVQVVINSTASTGEFSDSGWSGEWDLWQYFYQEAFYLGYAYNVERYQMYNEPDDGGPTGTNYLLRLQLASDAIQSAIADVNSMYGKSLTPLVFAPVTAGGVTSTYGSWGEMVVTNRNINFLGQSNASFSLIQKYDYHQYGGTPSSPSTFGTDLVYLEDQLSASMQPETPFPATITEFNVYDGSTFNGLNSTLDTPTNYSAFGAIAINLIENGINEIYCFKISQTTSAGYIAKNGTHYLDDADYPYNIGGITEGGEVWRLINKGFAPGRNLLSYQTISQTSALNLLASYDPVGQRYYLLSVNNTSGAIPLTVNMSAWQIPANNQVLVEAVNATCYGAGISFSNIGAASSINLTQGSNSVLLFTVPAQPQMPVQTIAANANAQVADGANKNVNYAGQTNLLVADNSTNANYRSAAFLQFPVSAFNPTNLQLAVLTVNATATAGPGTALAYVYGILSNNWSESNITWATAPNLAQGVSTGTAFTNNFLLGAGASAFMVGQLVPGIAPGQYTIDVTSFLKNFASSNVSFLLERGVRFAGDDADGDGVSIVSREGAPSAVPSLRLVFNQAPTPTLNSPQLNGNAFSFTVTGAAGYVYNIETATNLPQWSSLMTVTNQTGSVVVNVANPAGPASFYRAVMVP